MCFLKPKIPGSFVEAPQVGVHLTLAQFQKHCVGQTDHAHRVRVLGNVGLQATQFSVQGYQTHRCCTQRYWLQILAISIEIGFYLHFPIDLAQNWIRFSLLIWVCLGSRQSSSVSVLGNQTHRSVRNWVEIFDKHWTLIYFTCIFIRMMMLSSGYYAISWCWDVRVSRALV